MSEIDMEAREIASCPPRADESIESSMRPLTPRVRKYLADEATRCGVTPEQILSRSRKRHVTYARRRVAVRLRNDGFSYPQIGRWLGLNHTSVIYYMEGAAPPGSLA